jgi:hypothetical protein
MHKSQSKKATLRLAEQKRTACTRAEWQTMVAPCSSSITSVTEIYNFQETFMASKRYSAV